MAKLTIEDKIKIIQLYNEGYGCGIIARKIGIDQYVEGMPIYQQPVMYNQNMMNGQMAYNPNQYQGNVSTEPLKQTPYQDYVAPNYYNPYSNM